MSRLIYFSIPIFVAVIFYSINTNYISPQKPKSLGRIQQGPPKNSSHFGRFTHPLKAIDFSSVATSSFYNFTALKFWDFKSITTEKYFIAVAIANLNYISTAFVYVIDRSDKSQSSIYQYTSKSILAQGIQEQQISSIENGCTKFYRSSDEWIWICYDKVKETYGINGTVIAEKENKKLTFNFEIKYLMAKNPSMALIYPVEESQPVYTHKIAGLPSSGKLRIGNGEEKNLVGGLGAMDWTFGYPERICQWKWSSLSVHATNLANNKSVTIGINLSDLVYNDINGVSMESAIWIDNHIYTTNKLTWKLPKAQNLLTNEWKIYSETTNSDNIPKINLSFKPWGAYEEHINAIIVQADFVQAFGSYHGTIELKGITYAIKDGFGVAEKHFSKW